MNNTHVKLYLLNALVRISMVVGAVIMGINNINGYGWLIAGAILCGLSFETENEKTDE